MSYTNPSFWLLVIAMLGGMAMLAPPFRVAWLFTISLLFYIAPDPMRLIWLAGVGALTLVAYGAGAERHPWRMRAIGIAALSVVLVWAKFAGTLGLPAPDAPPGLSFLIFTAIALLIEAARRGAQWTRGDVALHLGWFPKLLAGPIERPQTLIPQFPALRTTATGVALGASWILSGLVKKLVVADALAPVVDRAFAIPAFATPMDLIVACYFFAFQIYCDFSGYAEIAIGLSLLVGLHLSRNFDRPYLAVTVSEFWGTRWHITLAQWFRDYLYIPLGGSRHGWLRRVLAIMAVFAVSGLWHAGLGYGVGWGFLVWGALNGLFVVAETRLPRPRRRLTRLLRGILTFHLVLIAWVFFRASDPGAALTVLARTGAALPDVAGLVMHYPFATDQIIGAGLIALVFGIEALSRSPVAERIAKAPLPLRWAGWYAALAALLIGGHWGGSEFIYAGF